MTKLGSFSAATFNMLAPCYKREKTDGISTGRMMKRESHTGWEGRAEKSLAFFESELLSSFSIVAVQEFWLGKSE